MVKKKNCVRNKFCAKKNLGPNIFFFLVKYIFLIEKVVWVETKCWVKKFYGIANFLIRDQGICEIIWRGCSPLENCRVNALIDLKSNSVYH